jgi:para-nitrobenzyl esterase
MDIPLQNLNKAGLENMYAYRYDWDDHRRFPIANFKVLIGAAHATEIPLISGDYKLVGGYPLSDLIYPRSFSKRYTSKNMMKFWTNFAKFGSPGLSTNSVKWESYLSNKFEKGYLIIDNKKNLRMENNKSSMKSLTENLYSEQSITDVEKCVILLQMFTYVGNDDYRNYIKNYPGECVRSQSENFLKENASFIEY